ncbi:hypothetical protein DFH28DRAFT_890757, partial [Melampsora americana]
LQLSIIPRTYAASEAFGIESRSQITPNLRCHPSQLVNGLMYDQDEASYCSSMGNSIFTPTSLTQMDSRQPTAGISIGSEQAGGEFLSNIVASIASKLGLTPTQTAQINKCFQVSTQVSKTRECFLTSLVAQNPVSKAGTQVTVPTRQESETLHDPKTEWKGKENIQQFMQDTIRDCLMKPVIQAYSTANLTQLDHNVIDDSVENLAMELVVKSQGHVKDADLFGEFCSGDLAAKCAVEKVLKEIAKSEKSKLQIELIHNIKDPELDLKVPTLKDLYFWLCNPR